MKSPSGGWQALRSAPVRSQTGSIREVCVSEQSSESKRNVAIKACDCVSPFQDKTYGKGLRVHNRTKQNSPEPVRRWRCAVCGKEK